MCPSRPFFVLEVFTVKFFALLSILTVACAALFFSSSEMDVATYFESRPADVQCSRVDEPHRSLARNQCEQSAVGLLQWIFHSHQRATLSSDQIELFR